jgi:phosphate transport system substrate-binding protein
MQKIRSLEGTSTVKLHPRYAAVGAGVLALATLSACGSNNNTPSSSTGGTTSGSTGSSSSTSAATIACGSGTLAGAGSTAQQNAISQWVKDYQQSCSGATINYNPNGSGSGITAFTNKQADWAGSDFPLNATQQTAADARCGTGKAVSIATVPGVIAVMYNVPSASQQLNLSASTLAKIFNGKITNWNDPAIATDNPGVTLASLPIQTFHRSDGSGTSFNFSNYLNKEAPTDFPATANKAWPGTGGQGVQGSSGVAKGVQSTPGSIGYAEVSFATQANLKYANVGNAGGKFVPLNTANAQNFISKAKTDTSNGNIVLTFDYTNTDADAYPVSLVTYEITCSAGNDSSKLPLLKGFLGYLASGAAQAKLPGLGYVSLPTSLQSQVVTAFSGLS